jgi:hypothetical protein
VRFYDQLRLYLSLLDRVLDGVSAQLGKVLQKVLLPRMPCLVLVSPLGGLLRLAEEAVEDPEVDARDPDCARPVQRCAEHAALLYVLPFRRRQFEGLWFRECGERLAVVDPQWQCQLLWALRTIGSGRQVLDYDAGPFALGRRFGTLDGRLFCWLRCGRGFFTGTRPRRPSRLGHCLQVALSTWLHSELSEDTQYVGCLPE